MVKLDITLPSEGKGQGFESLRAHHQILAFMKLPQRIKASTKQKPTERLQGAYQAEIIGLTHHAQGVARIGGKTIFIDQAIPGDLVELRITKDEPKLAFAKITKRLKDSADRVEPFCQYFGKCGGCRLQMQSVSAQIKWKQANFLDPLKKSLDTRKLEVFEPIQAETVGYRRRAKMVLVKDKRDKSPRLGFKGFNSDQVIDIEQCPILTPALNDALPKFRFDLLPLASRQARDVYFVEGEQGVWVSSDIYSSQPSKQLPFYPLSNLKLSFEPSGFIQVNASINQQLVKQAVDWLAPNATDRVLDLFCGVGNFSLMLAQKAGLVVGIEGLKSSIDLAKQNALDNKITNTQFHRADLSDTPIHQAWWSDHFDAILLDPGRLGAQELCAELGRFKAKRIVYVSCQSSTLIRDLKLLEQQGYKLKRAQIFDMFSHTDHYESLILLEKD